MKTIGLCLIVKNESHVIRRCLDSVKRLIDYVLIVDTGSDDNTIEVINGWLVENNMSGEAISEPWQNFAYNRSFALTKLREKEFIDYSLMIDADETLFFEDSFDVDNFKSNLEFDVYNVRTNMWGSAVPDAARGCSRPTRQPAESTSPIRREIRHTDTPAHEWHHHR
jgi:glycosyltransferase involved in cell wall biosynthesis